MTTSGRRNPYRPRRRSSGAGPAGRRVRRAAGRREDPEPVARALPAPAPPCADDPADVAPVAVPVVVPVALPVALPVVLPVVFPAVFDEDVPVRRDPEAPFDDEPAADEPGRAPRAPVAGRADAPGRGGRRDVGMP